MEGVRATTLFQAIATPGHAANHMVFALREANVTVTEVRLSPDLRNATAFVMPLGGEKAEEIMAGLRRSAPFLKARLARMVELRHVPNIAFAFDNAFDSAARISALLASPAVERDLHPPAEDDDDTA